MPKWEKTSPWPWRQSGTVNCKVERKSVMFDLSVVLTLAHAALFGVLLHAAFLQSLVLEEVEGKEQCLNLTSEAAWSKWQGSGEFFRSPKVHRVKKTYHFEKLAINNLPTLFEKWKIMWKSLCLYQDSKIRPINSISPRATHYTTVACEIPTKTLNILKNPIHLPN